MADYTEIKYVDANFGSDELGDGSEEKPYQTIQYCKLQLTTSNPLVYIADGEYELDNILDIRGTKRGMNISYMGGGMNTILNIYKTVNANNSVNYFVLSSCVITPSEDSTMISMFQEVYGNSGSSNDIYNNVLFLNRGLYLRYFFNPTNDHRLDVKFYNCSFVEAKATRAGTYGSMKFYDCVTTENENSDGLLPNCLINEDYFITDETGIGVEENNTYGVYSGEYAWTALLLRQDGQYYSINSSLYDKDTLEYTPLPNVDFRYRFNAKRLFEETTIDDETFKPIDKFNNFSLVLPVLRANNLVKLNAIKSNKELVVQTFDVNVTLLDKIHQLYLNKSDLKAEDIKLIFSKDMGDSWVTIQDNEVVPTDCIIPRKRYEDFTNDDLLQFNSAKETISEVGFSPDMLSSFDFNKEKIEILRFAYVLSTNNYVDNPFIESLNMDYDDKGYLQDMKDSECDIEVFEHTVKVTSKVDSPSIETNIII